MYYLEPQYRQKDETPVEFAARVQLMIARRGNLISRNWDGYMKYWQPSARFKRAQQLTFARQSFPSVFEQQGTTASIVAPAPAPTETEFKSSSTSGSSKQGIRQRVGVVK